MKFSIQRRHNIEKQRQRYHLEKQWSLENVGKFSSSSDLFHLLDSMNFASVSVDESVHQDHIFIIKLEHEKVYGNYVSNLGSDHGFDFDNKFGGGYRIGDDCGSMADFHHSFGQGIDSVGEPKNHGRSNLNYDYDNDSKKHVDEGIGFQVQTDICIN
ncbi:hypothetical protein CXB51_032263 [Gossypium anomalum]|uniref:Uncharacterized protein n=1 Tax=Gossypium anomalum TaxID=47600 RepID=A0A8J6CLN8_9ROSI|nr:hypothetical protein CXB51_032263 [Gossypium anomalum]